MFCYNCYIKKYVLEWMHVIMVGFSLRTLFFFALVYISSLPLIRSAFHTHMPYTTSLYRLLGWPLRWKVHSSRVFWLTGPYISFWFWLRERWSLRLFARSVCGRPRTVSPSRRWRPWRGQCAATLRWWDVWRARVWLRDASVSTYWGCAVGPSSTSSQHTSSQRLSLHGLS